MTEKTETIAEDHTRKIDAIDTAMLTPLVQRALGRSTIKVIEWDVQQIHGGTGGGIFTSVVYRFIGQVLEKDQIIPWSLILKTFFPEDTVDPSSPYYPQRELEAYRSGWLDNLPGDLAAPACYGVVEYPDGEIWVWLEQVVDDYGGSWPLERYGLAARHLGLFNGRFLVNQSLPTWPWFSKHWLRRAVSEIAPTIAQLPKVLNLPLVRRYFPGDTGNRFLQLWAEREHLLDVLDQMPRTICHLDAFSRNLFSRRSSGVDETIVIDWAFVGYGALGEEIEPLVCRSLVFTDIKTTQAEELDRAVFAGYLDGLRDAGWQGNYRKVRLGYTSAVTLRFLVSFCQFLPFIIDGSVRDLVPQILGLPFDETVDHSVACIRFQFGLADEALELLETLQ
jgi:hypothetical protein